MPRRARPATVPSSGAGHRAVRRCGLARAAPVVPDPRRAAASAALPESGRTSPRRRRCPDQGSAPRRVGLRALDIPAAARSARHAPGRPTSASWDCATAAREVSASSPRCRRPRRGHDGWLRRDRVPPPRPARSAPRRRRPARMRSRGRRSRAATVATRQSWLGSVPYVLRNTRPIAATTRCQVFSSSINCFFPAGVSA